MDDAKDIEPAKTAVEGEEEWARVARLRQEADEAFAKAQAEFDPVVFDKENPHFKNRYGSLLATLKATRPHLNKYGISLRSSPDIVGDDIVVRVKLCYKGVVFDQGVWPVSKKNLPMQQQGSANTYAVRYTANDLLGIAGQDDDDGEAAHGNVNPPKTITPVDVSDVNF